MRTYAPKALFASATLLPAACILMAVFLGGFWVWVAFLSMTLLVLAMDLTGFSTEAGSGLLNWLPFTVGLLHFPVLWASLWAIGQGMYLDSGEKVILVLTLGLFAGQISNSCAHELIHRPERKARALGTAIFCSILNGHHVSAHMLLHHIHAGTEQDPNSAALGRGFYRFASVATFQEFMLGWRAETKRRRDHAAGLHPYAIYLSGVVVSVAIASLLGGFWGVAALCCVALHAQVQLMLSDYVQHYGLRRQLRPSGKPEPMGPQHSWNAPHPYSSALMMNAPRHSDHHMTPTRRFADLGHSETTMPTLPYSLPVMGAMALYPPLWRRKMDPLVRRWSDAQGTDTNQSNPVFSPSVASK